MIKMNNTILILYISNSTVFGGIYIILCKTFSVSFIQYQFHTLIIGNLNINGKHQ